MPLVEYHPNAGEYRGSLPPATNPFVVNGVRFLPGINQPSEVEWQSLMEHPTYSNMIKMRLDMGKLRVVPGLKKDQEPSIKDFNPTQAVAMINACNDVDLLERWASEDARPSSQDAIAAQIERVSVPAAPKGNRSRTAAKASVSESSNMPVFT